MQMGEGGEWGAKFRRIFAQGVALRSSFGERVRPHWLVARRNGVARGMCHRVADDDPSPSIRISMEARNCRNALLSSGGFSAYQLAFELKPTDFCRYGGATTKTFSLLRTPDCRGGLPNGGNSASWRRMPR